jgi:WD repeat-containing protein 76
MVREVGLSAINIGPRPEKRTHTAKPAAPKKKVKREPRETVAPRRVSARLQGIVAEDSVHRERYEEEAAAQRELERLKRLRRSGDFRLADLDDEEDGEMSRAVLRELACVPFDREEFERESVGARKELAQVRKEFAKMELFGRWIPKNISITPERIYAIGMHPSPTKPLVFAGDKVGNLGIWDVFGSVDDDDGKAQPLITSYKFHSRTISQFLFSPVDATKLYTASYDTTIRLLDLTTGTATEVYYLPEGEEDEDALISSLQLTPDGTTLMFSNLYGQVGKLDIREPSKSRKTSLYALHEKKIGGLSIFPSLPSIFATSSLDRTMKLWDLRKMADGLPVCVGEYTSRLSISSAEFNRVGDIVATSYDDTLTVFNGVVTAEQPVGKDLGGITPSERVLHNNQTGRYVSVLKAKWHDRPENGFEKFCVGDMKKSTPLPPRFLFSVFVGG